MPKLPTIKIKGSEYTLVKDRILYFNETYENGCIQSSITQWGEGGTIVIKARVYPDGLGENKRMFTGHAQEVIGDGYINKTSALENCETSAVGRALAMMGIGVLDSIASVDEINKAETRASADTSGSDPKKKCIDCGKDYTPKAGMEAFSTKCYPCYKENGKDPIKKEPEEIQVEDIPFTG